MENQGKTEKHRETGENVEKHGKTWRMGEKHRKTRENRDNHGKTGRIRGKQENTRKQGKT